MSNNKRNANEIDADLFDDSSSSTPREVRVKIEVGGADRPIDIDDTSSSSSSPSEPVAKNTQRTTIDIEDFKCPIIFLLSHEWSCSCFLR